MLEILLMVRRLCKGFNKARLAKAAVIASNEEVLRQGMAYACEVGQGAPLMEKIIITPGNPFMDKNWRKKVLPGEETKIS